MTDDTRAAVVNKELDFEYENDEYRTNGDNYFFPETYIFLIECDGGPDHNLTFYPTKLLFLAYFGREHI